MQLNNLFDDGTGGVTTEGQSLLDTAASLIQLALDVMFTLLQFTVNFITTNIIAIVIMAVIGILFGIIRSKVGGRSLKKIQHNFSNKSLKKTNTLWKNWKK